MRVILYTQETCGPCHAQKAWLQDNGISFEERDIRKRPAYINELIDLGASATPVTVIEIEKKKEVVRGFDKGRLASLLNIQP